MKDVIVLATHQVTVNVQAGGGNKGKKRTRSIAQVQYDPSTMGTRESRFVEMNDWALQNLAPPTESVEEVAVGTIFDDGDMFTFKMSRPHHSPVAPLVEISNCHGLWYRYAEWFGHSYAYDGRRKEQLIATRDTEGKITWVVQWQEKTVYTPEGLQTPGHRRSVVFQQLERLTYPFTSPFDRDFLRDIGYKRGPVQHTDLATDQDIQLFWFVKEHVRNWPKARVASDVGRSAYETFVQLCIYMLHPALAAQKKKITLVVAMGANRAIGRNNELPWRCSADMKLFRENTLGKTILMGGKTAQSIGWKALPGRKNLVLTRGEPAAGFTAVGSLEEALQYVDDELVVIGGEQLYRLALPFASKICISEIHINVPDADTFFPHFDVWDWMLDKTKSRYFEADGSSPAFSYGEMIRFQSGPPRSEAVKLAAMGIRQSI